MPAIESSEDATQYAPARARIHARGSIGGVREQYAQARARAPVREPESEQRSASACEPAREAEAPSAAARTDAEIARFLERRARLMRWGWPEAEAESLADRLARRDRDAFDDRVSCADCRHYSGRHCANHKAAELGGRDVGRFAEMLQRCPGFRPQTDGVSDRPEGST